MGPYFFEDEDGSAVTIISARYTEMLENFLQLQLNELAADFKDIGSNKMGPLRTPHKEQCITWGSSFLDTSSLTAEIFLGLHGHLMLHRAISSFGAIWKEKYKNIVHVIWLSEDGDSGGNLSDNTSYDYESDEELKKTFNSCIQYPKTSYGRCCIPQVNCINLWIWGY